MSGLRIVALVDNTVLTRPGLLGEHGLSLFVEWRSHRLLFDTGQTGVVVHNAGRLGIDLRAVEMVILSHGHYDHVGGLLPVLEARGGVPLPVIAHPDLFAPHYSRRRDRLAFVGAPWRPAAAESYGAAFRLERYPREVVPGIWVTGEVRREVPFETGDPHLVLAEVDGARPDLVLDDLSVVIHTDRGLVVLLGCAHAGLVNILQAAQQIVPGVPVYAVIGGSHLGAVGEVQREATLRYLEQTDIPVLRLAHCTATATGLLHRRLLGRFAPFPAGSEFTLDG